MHRFRNSAGPSSIPNRPSWSHRLDFLVVLLSIQNVETGLRLAHGTCLNGGSFFFVYLLLIFCFFTFPATVMETGLGQLCGRSSIEIWNWICPLFKGAAYIWMGLKFFMSCRIAAQAGKALFYLIATIIYRTDPPWNSCNYEWNLKHCRTNGSVDLTSTAAEDFLFNRVLGSGRGYSAFAVIPKQPFNWRLAGCTLFPWICCMPVLILGIRVLPKVLYVLLSLTFVFSLALVSRLAVMPGSSLGMKYFLHPSFHFRPPELFLTLPVFDLFTGTLFTIASYNDFKDKHVLDCFAAHIYCIVQLLLYGSIRFISNGILSLLQGREIYCSTNSPFRDALFVTTAPALSLASNGTFWSILLFLSLFLSFVASLLTNSEIVITSFLDAWGSHRKQARIIFSTVFVAGAILFNGLAATPTSYALTDLEQFFEIFIIASFIIFVFFCAFHFGSGRLAIFLGIINGCYAGTIYFYRIWRWVLIPLLILSFIKGVFYISPLLNIVPFVIWVIFLCLQLARANGSAKERVCSLFKPRWHEQLSQRFTWRKTWAPLDFEARITQGDSLTRTTPL